MNSHDESANDRADRFAMDADDGAGVVASQCLYCARFSAGIVSGHCQPFPGGIPREILANDFDHRQPHPDEDAPVRFTPRPGLPEGLLARLSARLDEATATSRDG